MLDITFSIPAYNDGNTIENLVKECIEFADQHHFKYQFLIIDDGSSDNTKSVIQKLESEYSNLTAIYHPVNLSFGPTLKEIFLLPQTEWICFLPGDYQFSAFDFLTPSLAFTKEYDFIIGKRIHRADNLYRLLVSKIYNQCISAISKGKVSDVNSAVLYKKKIVEGINFNGNSAFIHAELYLNAQQRGFKIVEVPIRHKKREYGKAGGSKAKVLVATFKDMLAYIFKD